MVDEAPPPFTAEERADLLDRIWKLYRKAAKAKVGGKPRWRDMASERAALETEYARRVPRPVVSYDPIAGAPFRLGIDTFGLDGFWWDLDGPPRPSDEPLPLTWYAFNGAIRLREPYEQSGFPVRVGPVAPFVVPRLLRRPGVEAVVSSLEIGHHDAWVIVYFAPWPPPPGKRVNEWARSSYRVRDGEGAFGWDTATDFPVEWDFDLKPWIELGKVRWTRPGAPGEPARSTVRDCPYLGLLGPGDPEGMGVLSHGNLRYGEITPAHLQGPNPNGD